MLQSFQSIKGLSAELQIAIRQVYAAGYAYQMRVMLYFCVTSLVSLVLLIEQHPRRAEINEEGELIMSGNEGL
jgi:hypothetical protein